MKKSLLFFLAIVLFGCTQQKPIEQKDRPKTYEQLTQFFFDWRKFQAPEIKDGVPDYSKVAMSKQHQDLSNWKEKLNAFDTVGWPIKHKIDWYLIWAEMNGLDFDHRVIRPWERDPAFYVWFYTEQSDVPEREGPNAYGAIELHRYPNPLTDSAAADLKQRLTKAKTIFEQAKVNLTGKAKDLWVLGTRSIREQSGELASFAAKLGDNFPDLVNALNEAKSASDEFAIWLDSQASTKTEKSGIGKKNYDWYTHNVHLSPYGWNEEKLLLERELMRSHSALRFAEHRNRDIPKLQKPTDAASYKKYISDGNDEFMKFLETDSFMTVKPYMTPAIKAIVRDYYEPDANGLRGFFDEVDYRDPMPMRAHFFHWIDKEREIQEPVESPIRQVPLLYNIFDSRAEGFATAMEELVMNEGLLKNRPRATELVYIMLAQRCARGLGGLYQNNNKMNFDEATRYASKWVPWGLMPAGGGTIQHEEHFYIQQPGYGSSYVTGKLDIDRLIAEYARQREGKFKLKSFMGEFNNVGIIPTSLVYWQMTGSRQLLDEALGR